MTVFTVMIYLQLSLVASDAQRSHFKHILKNKGKTTIIQVNIFLLPNNKAGELLRMIIVIFFRT